MRRLSPGVVVIAVAASLALPSAQARSRTAQLTGIVGTNDGFNITLNDARGQRVRWLPPGTYEIVVDDRSRIHNFHLASNDDPSVDFRTDVEFVGRKAFTVTFKDGDTYAYACEPHWRSMNGSFDVSSTPPPPPPPPPPSPRVRTLAAAVSAGGAVSLSRIVVAAGRYVITVRDRSKRANFHLRGPQVDRRTGIAFRGAVRWRVVLRRGTYRYGTDTSVLRRRLRVR